MTKTVKLRCGRVVLAKDVHGEPYPVTYSNLTQAKRKVAELGSGWSVLRLPGSRPIYVALDDQRPTEELE
jgi:hypothetical protein